MQIYGREVPDAEEILALYEKLTVYAGIWQKETFASTAKECGFKRVSEKKSGYFSFSAFKHVTGQAPVSGNLIEEIRLFIGGEPSDLSAELWEKDRKKHALLGKKYSELFTSKLGTPRVSNTNDIFEASGIRTRILVAPPVWVVFSSLEVIRQQPDDWWK
jgi:hypothetical protein